MSAGTWQNPGTAPRVHILFILASVVGAAVAVPLFYKFRMSEILFVGGLVGFIGVPMLLAILKPYPSQMHLRLAIALLVACPANYVVMDFWELGRDIFFLIAGVNVLYVSTIRAVDSSRSRQWNHFAIASVGVLGAMAAIFVMVLIYLYLVVLRLVSWLVSPATKLALNCR